MIWRINPTQTATSLVAQDDCYGGGIKIMFFLNLAKACLFGKCHMYLKY